MKRRIAPFFNRRAKREWVRQSQLILDSGLFDHDWYVQTYPEAAQVRGDPLDYFLETGWRRGHDPNPDFSVSRYLHDNADVARAGMNPLLHFLEFGLFEGRDAGGFEPTMRMPDPSRFAFGAAAPVARFEIKEGRVSCWHRAVELSRTDPNSVSRGGEIVGLAGPKMRRLIDNAFDWLGLVSGQEPERATTTAMMELAAGQVIDAWYVNLSRLRTRWAVNDLPAVIRAYQFDPMGDAISLVGEDMIATSLDVVDLQLANPLFPILFLVSEPQGTIRGWSFLVFPSLCRGGLHHFEMLACEGEVVAHSSRLAQRLRDIEKAFPAVTCVEVDISHSDGSGPLFQRYCRSWLEKVMRVEVISTPSTVQGRGRGYLEEEVAIKPARRRSGREASLRIASDMLPTIAALTESVSGEPTTDTNEVAQPLLVVNGCPSSQVILLKPPDHAPSSVRIFLDVPAWDWPRLKSVRARRFGPAAAIRYSRRDHLSDAQWFVPFAGPAPDDDAGSITWLIEPSRWTGEQLTESIEALAAQLGSKPAAIAFVGATEPWQWSMATAAFPERVHRFDSMFEVAFAAATDLVGYLGPNVVLHDHRATSFLSRMLQHRCVITASCVILDLERRGRHWRQEIGDAGALGELSSDNSRADYMAAIEALWRCTFAVANPTSDLWVGRLDEVKSWSPSTSVARTDGTHLCTALFTASRIARRRQDSTDNSLAVPEAADGNVTAYRALPE